MTEFVKVLSYDEVYDEKKLKAVKKLGIDAYEITAIAGFETGRTIHSVWMEKTDRNKNTDYDYFKWRKKMNQLIIQGFKEDMGVEVSGGGLFTNINNKHMICISDGFVEGEDAGITCRSFTSLQGWQDDLVPMNEAIQAQWNMAVTGFPKWYLACLFSERELVIKIVDRDDKIIEELITQVEAFWDNNIIKDKIPDVANTEKCTEAIYATYMLSNPSLEFMHIEEGEYDTLCEDIIKLRTDALRNKKILDYKMNKLKIKLGYHEKGNTSRFRIVWRTSSRQVFDQVRFEKDFPELYQKYMMIEYRRPLFIKAYSTKPENVKARLAKEKKYESLRNQKISK